ncbi:MAG TPA: DUF6030 family protein [Pararhizobium sp.]|uniref:DUF6030 family protein n=1 Tax=Pararhizobium sp. TaxID=1977563 RepID=UPI002CA77CE4|nr:DUF6030 family protein [Pararhizobium sp.]HTO31235.1 DUF6030 family protein [Pararhizobium sp.]
MTGARNRRSGRLFFIITLALVFIGILATVLLANRHRNLDLLLTSLGYPDLLPKEESAAKTATIKTSKGVRLTAAKMVLPTYAFADFKAPEQHFLRLIQSDPKTLCEKVKEGGFSDLDWTISDASKDKWQCSSTVNLPPRGADEQVQSSVFIFIKGDGENRVTSFRVKLNIENSNDAIRVADLAGNAANIFLRQVRWGNPSEILGKIHRLEAFDIRNFGSRIQFKREFGETPRYNFLANQHSKPGKESPGAIYFDRKRWFPLTGSDGLPMIDGMMAGESSQGLPLPEPTE